ncbi:uncharacterized protein METZ01_LOCUS21680 [marine metagenome]|uniref:Uncharacterized protein n=1 Tax=marine metagenome TaxID=408172 RepID=A0A381PP67_9ZZZZ
MCFIFSQAFQPAKLFKARFNSLVPQLSQFFSLRASKSTHRKVICIPAPCSGQLKFVLADSYLKNEDNNQIFPPARIPGPPFTNNPLSTKKNKNGKKKT